MKNDILYPVRRLHGYLHEKIFDAKKNRQFYRTILASNGKKILLLGTPTHPNIGDSAIVLAEHIFLKKCGVIPADIVEITFGDFRRMNYSVKKILKKCALVCWHGGGNMGTIWPHEEALRRRGLRKMPSAFPSFMFPQTIFYDNSKTGQDEKKRSIPIYNRRDGLTITAREQVSYQTMHELYPDADIILSPDVVLSCCADDFGVEKVKREGVLLCLRADKERALSEEERVSIQNLVDKTGISWKHTDMCIDRKITPEKRETIVCQKMMEFASSKLIITDRLHGMVFAALTGTPCIVLSNNNHKVQGTYEWIQYLPYIKFANSELEYILIEEMLNMPENAFSSLPLMPHFERMKSVILSKMK